jgi:pyruvate-ferredoxin/flavodoxin oxidoreductase
MAILYEHIYVASISMGANKQQLLTAFMEAETYPGPSLIICYAPCISHGFDMQFVQAQEKRAVTTGYWPLFRFNPMLAEQGKNPFVIDAATHDGDLQEFLGRENRFIALERSFPEASRMLRTQLEADYYKRHVLAETIADLSPQAWGIEPGSPITAPAAEEKEPPKVQLTVTAEHMRHHDESGEPLDE